MLVSTTFSVLYGRGSEGAFTECLGVRIVFYSTALKRSGKSHSHHCPARQQAEMQHQFTWVILKQEASYVGGQGKEAC